LTKQDYAYNIIFAFTIPFLAVIRTLKSKSIRFKHQLLTLLVGIYGSTIFLSTSDGANHLAKVINEYSGMSFKQFATDIYLIITFQGTEAGSADLYIHLLSYLCGAVLEMPFLFFPIVCLVYGYFFSGSMLLVFKYFNRTKKSLLFWGIAFAFIMLKNVEGANTVRTWTGLWILVYACLKYYDTGKIKYIALMFIPPFVHFSYFIMAMPAYVVLVIGNWKKVFFTLFILSFFFSFLTPNVQDVSDTLSQTEVGKNRTTGYLVEEEKSLDDKLENSQSKGSNWYSKFSDAGATKYATFLIIISIFFTGTYSNNMNKVETRLFSIGLLTLTLSNVTWFYYALQNRSLLVGIVFIFAAVLLFWQNPNRKLDLLFFKSKLISILLYLSVLILIPFLILKTSMLLGFISAYYIVAPFVVWIFPEVNMAIREFIKTVIL
jgi:hypothetical protein